MSRIGGELFRLKAGLRADFRRDYASLGTSSQRNRSRVEVDGERSLLSVLRDELDLTGAKYGCGEGRCGACTVLVDGRRGALLSDTSGLGRRQTGHHRRGPGAERAPPSAAGGLPGRGRDAVRLLHGGNAYVMGVGFLKKTRNPTEAEILRAMEGNICRCGTYSRIVAAFRQAANGGQGRERRRAMIEQLTEEIKLEPERYELTEGPDYQFRTRRNAAPRFFQSPRRRRADRPGVKDALAQQESGGGGGRGGARVR